MGAKTSVVGREGQHPPANQARPRSSHVQPFRAQHPRQMVFSLASSFEFSAASMSTTLGLIGRGGSRSSSLWLGAPVGGVPLS